MKAKEKNEIVISIAAKATVLILEHHKENCPGKTITKPELFPRISRRCGWLMEDSDDPIYDIEAIAPPDDKFLNRHWKSIKIQVADEYKKYIIPDTTGFRLGTLEEWCQLTPNKDLPIVLGISRSSARRSRIAKKHGAYSPVIDSKLKQLPGTEQSKG